MKSKTLKEIQQLVTVFRKEILFNMEYEDLDIQSVFTDHKNGTRRVVIIIEENVDLNETEELAGRYFKNHLFKVISREGRPESTVELKTGTGIRHSNGEGWGTYGGLFKLDNDPDNLYGLSNNHVIARINQARQGDRILGQANIHAGTLFNYIPLRPPPHVNYADAALFRIQPDHQPKWDPSLPGKVIGPMVNMKVYKKGYKTKLTYGFIKAVNGSSKVILNGKIFFFGNIIAILGINGHFNMPGDSGSVVLSMQNNLVGHVFAKYHQYCWALPISRIKPLLQ